MAGAGVAGTLRPPPTAEAEEVGVLRLLLTLLPGEPTAAAMSAGSKAMSLARVLPQHTWADLQREAKGKPRS